MFFFHILVQLAAQRPALSTTVAVIGHVKIRPQGCAAAAPSASPCSRTEKHAKVSEFFDDCNVVKLIFIHGDTCAVLGLVLEGRNYSVAMSLFWYNGTTSKMLFVASHTIKTLSGIIRQCFCLK